ncbi:MULTISPECIES: FliM/FliN family flagellar motor switch protein [unclassified Roseitalea]|uniref:flagellar motor switch protein FliM n=1 Tax=unclassified Roseitalea TaxID=2639107 RepID=UPI00273ED460|nr:MULTISPECIES: FliM/FliN family flagellar motor switch protein [unclassified Roseitalea]
MTIAGKYDLPPEERDVLDRILRRRVSEDAVRRVIARFGNDLAAHLNASARKAAPELSVSFIEDGEQAGARRPQLMGAANAAFCLGFAEASEDALLTLDRAGVDLLMAALLGADPDTPVAATAAEISQLEIGVLQTLAQLIVETRRARSPLVRLDRVDVVRGDDGALGGPEPGAVASLTFELRFGANAAWCWLDLAHHYLIGLSEKGADTPITPDTDDVLKVPDFDITVESVMPLAPMTLDDLARLQPGDVLECDPAGDGQATLRARGRNIFTTQLGKLGQVHAVRIAGPIAPMTAALEAHAHQQRTQGDKRDGNAR